MTKQIKTIKEATQEWVSGFNAIPSKIFEKLLKADCEELTEITPPSKYDRVSVWIDQHGVSEGEIIGQEEASDGEIFCIVKLDSGEEIKTAEDCCFVIHDDFLPVWGTLWTFGEKIDTRWLDDPSARRAMANCGFRIYEQEDFEYVFGIDGAGYDFYEQHWTPLYQARGLQWHDIE